MTLDANSLLAAFGVLALVMLILFYGVTYRATRSAYCGWWCIALAAFMAGTSIYTLQGTAQQYWAIPCGNFMIALGGAAIWAGARTLRAPRPKMWWILLGPALTLVASAMGNPDANAWSGGFVFLMSVCVLFGLAAFELWQMDRTHTQVQVLLAVAAGFVSCFYFGRWVMYMVEGPKGEIFTTYFGTATTTLLNLIILTAVSYSMSELSHEQTTKELTTRATRDGLTGLLNRSEFLRLAALETRALQRPSNDAALILADLDHFKNINDSYGHATGDRVLREFSTACVETIRSTDLVARYGGEEFILLLHGTTLDRAEQITAEINVRLQAATGFTGIQLPTVSYGIGPLRYGADLAATISAVDAALYRAKQLGRNQTSRVDDFQFGNAGPSTDPVPFGGSEGHGE